MHGDDESCGLADLVALVLAEKYFELLKDRKVKGYLGQEKNYFGKDVPEGYSPKTAGG